MAKRQEIRIRTSAGDQFHIDPQTGGEQRTRSLTLTWRIAATPDLVMANITFVVHKPLTITITSTRLTSAFLVLPTSQQFAYKQTALPDDVIQSGQFQFTFVPALHLELTLHSGDYSLFTFQFTPEMLNQWMPEPIIANLLEHMTERKTALINARPMELTAPMAAILKELADKKFTEQRFALLLESRALDLLRMALDELNPGTLMYSSPLKPDDVEKIRKVKEYILEKLDDPLTMKDIAEASGLSESKLKSGFKEFYHTTVFDYLRSQRLQRARTQLIETHLDLKIIAHKAGYRSLSNFSSAFKRMFRCSPTSLRRS